MNVPMEWSTRGLSRRDADQAFVLTERLLQKIDRRWPSAVACRIAVERDAWGAREREVEGPVRVRVELTIPSRPPLVAVRRPDEGWPGEGVDPPLFEAFRRILAQLDTATKVTTRTTKRDGSRRNGRSRRWLALEL